MDDLSLAWKTDGVIYDNGPDQILPSKALFTSHPDGATKINFFGKEEEAEGNGRPISVPSLLHRAARCAPTRTALAVKRNGEWVKWTYAQYLEDVRLAAKGFIALGLERHRSVCILSSNSPEWFLSNMAAMYAGGISTGVYTTNSAEICAFIAKDSLADIFIVEDDDQLEKILKVRNELPQLKAIIQCVGELKGSMDGVYSWSELIKLGAKQENNVLEERLKRIAINQPCSLVYTSGTTGPPKGAMLSHDNYTWLARVNCDYCDFQDFKEMYVSFLPLSHTGAQMADIYCGLTCYASIYFGDKNALKGTLMDTVKEVQPTKFMVVTRICEKIYERMQLAETESSGLKKVMLNWAKHHGLDYNLKRMNGIKNPETIQFKIANYFILSKIKVALGLTNVRNFYTGAAPISPEIVKYFMSINMPFMEVYGMSECCGPHSVGVNSAFRLGSVGKTLPGALTKIDKPNELGIGEICMAGRHVQMGYLNHPEKAAEILDEEGWLHSGDLGRMDEDGYIFITGRIKEILITAGGENVAPVPIENIVKNCLPVVSQAMLLGDKLRFISVLLTLKTEIDKETQVPLKDLLPFTKDWVKKNGDCDCVTIDDVLEELYEKKNKKLEIAFQAGIDAANEKSISRAQKIQKWRLLPVDFSIPGGEFGPSLKLKRNVVAEKYKQIIDEIYQ